MNIKGWMGTGAAGIAGAVLVVGVSLLAGCPSQSTRTSSPPPVAQAAGFHGTVFGGRQPIAGATVVAYASGTSPGTVAAVIGTATTARPDGSP